MKSERTPSALIEKHIEIDEKEIELDNWVKELQKLFPTIPEHFIRTLAKAYQLNPERYDEIIKNETKLPAPEQDKPGSYNAVNVYNDVSEIPKIDDKSEFKAKEWFVE
jgi:hypothetical protein